MSTPQERLVLAGDYRVRVFAAGHGDPLLFLHSALGAGVWTEGIDRLAQHFQVLLPDHPGFGPSPLPDWLTGMDDMVFHYLDLLDGLGLHQPVRIAGVSFGGWIGAEFAAFHPERVHKLVLIDAAGLRIPAVPLPDVFRLAPQAVLPLVFHDATTGHIFARTSWDDDATWLGYFDGNLQLFKDGKIQSLRPGAKIKPVKKFQYLKMKRKSSVWTIPTMQITEPCL